MIKRIALGLVLTLFWLNPAFAKNPVLIVPGINSISQDMKDGCLVKTLQNAGIDTFTMADVGKEFSNRGQGFIQEDVKLLKQAIDEVKRRTGATKVDIVAYSRGGLVAELYTMMFGDQYQSSMEYPYIDTTGKPKKKTISNIPRYDYDINQIIMMGTPHLGSELADIERKYARQVKKVDEILTKWGLHDPPDADSVGIEQLQIVSGSFYFYFGSKELHPDVRYINGNVELTALFITLCISRI
ncbi:MAG: hypothetical protein AB1414_19635 [bacterium]